MDGARPRDEIDNNNETFSCGYTHVTTFDVKPIVGRNSVIKSRFNFLTLTALDEHLENINTFHWRIINGIIVWNNLTGWAYRKGNIRWSHKKTTSMLSLTVETK